MNFWILMTNFHATPCKTHGYGPLFYNVFVLCVWKIGILNQLCSKIKYPLNEWNVILIYYIMNFSKFQKLLLFQRPFKAFKNNY
jgi:hypothetical protein